MGKLMRAIGLMSGTSLDGIDVAMIDTDGADELVRGPCATYPYDDNFKGELQTAIADAKLITAREQRPGALASVEARLTEVHADAVRRFLKAQRLEPRAISFIGFHGQTVLHVPPRVAVETVANGIPFDRPVTGMTVQIGDGPRLAALTGIDVVYDMRAADVAAGGQGAPLVPVYHRALVAGLPQRPLVFVNIGGVANVTWIGRDGQMVAFDTGPGSAMIDDWMRAMANEPCDLDGATAAKGVAHQDYVAEYLRHSHFSSPPPKSLDRNAFPIELVGELSLEDGAATLTAFAAAAIARSREFMPAEPQLWIVGGGGRRNRTLMSMLAGLVQNAVVPAEAVGLDGDSIEAEAWAYLAVRSYRGFPLTYSGTTGVRRPQTGGVMATAPER